MSDEELYGEVTAETFLAETLSLETLLSEFAELSAEFVEMSAKRQLAESLPIEKLTSEFEEMYADLLSAAVSAEKLLNFRQTKLPSSLELHDR